MFQHLDTVIAFGALMLAASLVIVVGTQLIISVLGLRGTVLRTGLTDLFEQASQDSDARRYGKVIAHRVLRHPLISDSAFSRFSIRVDKLPFVPADAAGKLRWAGSEIPLQPWLLGALTGFFLCPALLAIFDRLLPLDICEYAGTVAHYVPLLNLCDHPWRTGAILGCVLGGLLSRWRLATSVRLDELLSVLEKLSAPANGTLPDPAQRAMLVIACERRSQPRPKTNAVAVQMNKMLDLPEESEGGVAVAVEKSVGQISTHGDKRLEGLAFWFERIMERASQRLTLQARIITVVLSFLLVFGAHLDAVRLFQSLSTDAQARAQLAASADAMVKEAEQLPHGKESGSQAARESTRGSVPDVYRSAMTVVLEPVPVVAAEPIKAKSHHSARSSASSVSNGTEPLPSAGSTAPSDVQISAGATGEGEQVSATAVSQIVTEGSAKERGKKPASAAKKSETKEREKPAVATREDFETVEAKAKAERALQARPGFASREDAALWLRGTLNGDPALENLEAAYDQEVNSALGSDADKLLDQAASIKRQLARSQPRLLPEAWPGWQPSSGELPGLLISIAFLCIGAPLCFNLLKRTSSLLPLPSFKADQHS